MYQPTWRVLVGAYWHINVVDEREPTCNDLLFYKVSRRTDAPTYETYKCSGTGGVSELATAPIVRRVTNQRGC